LVDDVDIDAFSRPFRYQTSTIVSRGETPFVGRVNARDVIAQSQHLVTECDSIFDVSGPQCLIAPDMLIFEALSGTNDLQGRSQQ
jgi:hypothetical protein